MSQPQASGGACNYGQFLSDHTPRYDNQVKKGKRRKKKKGEK